MTIERALKIGQRLLINSTSPILDTEVLLSYVLDCARTNLITKSKLGLNYRQLVKFLYLILKRRLNWPVAYLVGCKEFYGRNFVVNKDVLVPRPASELLVEETIDLVKRLANQQNYVIEIGTGSGCIAISLMFALPQTKIIATDISSSALKIARLNAKNYKINHQLEFIAGDMLTPLLEHKNCLMDSLIIANPPYLLPSEITKTLRFEPKIALLDGAGSLNWYKKLFSQIAGLTPTNRPRALILEINPLTSDSLVTLIKNILPLCQVDVKNDLSGFKRILTVSLAKNNE